jgi:hypothetical protein
VRSRPWRLGANDVMLGAGSGVPVQPPRSHGRGTEYETGSDVEKRTMRRARAPDYSTRCWITHASRQAWPHVEGAGRADGDADKPSCELSSFVMSPLPVSKQGQSSFRLARSSPGTRAWTRWLVALSQTPISHRVHTLATICDPDSCDTELLAFFPNQNHKPALP